MIRSGFAKLWYFEKSRSHKYNELYCSELITWFQTPGILNPNQYKAFKVVFSPDGDGTIKFYKTSDQISSEINSLPRKNDGSLYDKSYIIQYEETPLFSGR